MSKKNDIEVLAIEPSTVLHIAAKAAEASELAEVFDKIAYPPKEEDRGGFRIINSSELLAEPQRFADVPEYVAREEAYRQLDNKLAALEDEELTQLDALYWYGHGVYSSFASSLKVNSDFDGTPEILAKSIAGHRDLAEALVRALSRVLGW